MILGEWVTTAVAPAAVAGALPTDTPEERLRRSSRLSAPSSSTAPGRPWWFGAFALLVVVSALIDGLLPEPYPPIPSWLVVAFFALDILGPAVTTFALLEYFVRSRDRAYRLLTVEQNRSERLLLSIFPSTIAERLKVYQNVIAERSDEVSVLFADITGFTPVAERLPAEEVVVLLDGSSRRSIGSWRATGSRRSRRSATATWSPRGSPRRAPTMRRRRPACARHAAGARRAPCGGRAGPPRRHRLWALRRRVIGRASSATTSGATRLTPRAGCSPTRRPARSRSPSERTTGSPRASSSGGASTSRSRARAR